MLLWIQKPTIRDCKKACCNSGKFFCGRKSKFGLNMQAVCDSSRRFLDVSIEHPGSTSNFLVFCTSRLFKCINTEGFLHSSLCLYGDNAYVNTNYMATPFEMAKNGLKDDFNFYHSQLRINIENAFGMLVERWRILKTPLTNISIGKSISLTLALCRLHNFLINAKEKKHHQNTNTTIFFFLISIRIHLEIQFFSCMGEIILMISTVTKEQPGFPPK